jgi:hypothetical protein
VEGRSRGRPRKLTHEEEQLCLNLRQTQGLSIAGCLEVLKPKIPCLSRGVLSRLFARENMRHRVCARPSWDMVIADAAHFDDHQIRQSPMRIRVLNLCVAADEAFSANQILTLLKSFNVPSTLRTVKRTLELFVGSGLLKAEGKGPSRRYRKTGKLRRQTEAAPSY